MSFQTAIAIVGMGGVFPGADRLDLFWRNILNKVDCTREIPPDRWIAPTRAICDPEPKPDKAFTARCCPVDNFEFDRVGFDLDPDLARQLDPLYHMVLHSARAAVSEARLPRFKRRRTGVVLAAIVLPTDASSAITRDLFAPILPRDLNLGQPRSAPNGRITRERSLAARVTSLPAAILAEALGLGGGTFTLDAACASSLYAIKLACDELLSRRADAMLAGGVSRPDCLYTQVGFSQLRALSPSGRCAPFDERADGLVVGEGAGILLLKRLDDALRDDDHIYALIRGIGLSNDLRGNLLAPDSEGQLRAMHQAYQAAGWQPQWVDLIECHGAGTPTGDAVELQSLNRLWGASGWSRGQCAIGSVKSMIGHLLTAAGAAGTIKTLLSIQHRILPPSLNFRQAAPGSPLHNSPFRVQCEPEPWARRENNQPRRAAVSAFGFGGINAHLLLEEPLAPPQSQRSKIVSLSQPKPASSPAQPTPVAIVGMETVLGPLNSLRQFQETVFNGRSALTERPSHRWKGCDDLCDAYLENPSLIGAYLDTLSMSVGDFHIPPNEIADILPQHLLMLKVAAAAMQDAQLGLRQERLRMGTLIGIDFDFEATNFHLRWIAANSPGNPRDSGSGDSPASALDLNQPPLTAARTLGALGGIIASRIAREFRFGGPSLVVSCEEASGIKALEIGSRLLQQDELEAVLVGAVDLAGEMRRVILSGLLRPFSASLKIRPFDRHADGGLPGEGAVAMVVKPLDRALADGNRIYAVIKGIGKASGRGAARSTCLVETYRLSMKRALEDAGVASQSIGYVETHGSAIPAEDATEAAALAKLCSDRFEPCAIGALKPNIGHTGAAAGLASVAKASLCLYHELLAPLKNFSMPAQDVWHRDSFHFPAFPQYWVRNRADGPRRALVGAMTPDGNCMHVLLEEHDHRLQMAATRAAAELVARERKRPLGPNPFGLFVVESDRSQALLQGLQNLDDHLQRHADPHSQTPECGIEDLARSWYAKVPLRPHLSMALALAAPDVPALRQHIEQARQTIIANRASTMAAAGGVHYSPQPLAPSGQLAFVFPGSGNHFLGMGRQLGVVWPEVLRNMDAANEELKTQLLPQYYYPWRISWESGWHTPAYDELIADPLHTIFGQVVFAGIMVDLLQRFDLKPQAVIGYSLGETAGLFAMGAWPERSEMLNRMRRTNLFTTELAGPCNAARTVWNLADDQPVAWRVAVVNRAAETVRGVVNKWPTARLLIVNTPDECVIAGRQPHVEAVIRDLGCEAFFLDGVVTVHCDAVRPVADVYKELHVFPTAPPPGIRFYSCALGRAYQPTSESAAQSILQQALHGFDFPATIAQAYADGVRVFLELGPGSSCARMIRRILQDRPHLALSVSMRGEDEYAALIKALGAMLGERIPVRLGFLYGEDSYPLPRIASPAGTPAEHITLPVGGKSLASRHRHQFAQTESAAPAAAEIPVEQSPSDPELRTPTRKLAAHASLDPATAVPDPSLRPLSDLVQSFQTNIAATVASHDAFLQFSREITQSFAETSKLQAQLLERVMEHNDAKLPVARAQTASVLKVSSASPTTSSRTVAFAREQCLEFARGSVAEVLGPEFAVVDGFQTRVRLPDEPLMLVDRIISVTGNKGVLGPGRIVTEHDVRPEAWYLDGGRAPACISVEAGQADLFLSAYLGIDLVVRGRRTYRLLDATVKFHRSLPVPGETLRYEIEIQKFVRQAETHLFFFNFVGYVGDTRLITMTDGCAGFFTSDEVRQSGGIILTAEDAKPLPGRRSADWQDLVEVKRESYDDQAISQLRKGNLAACFGPQFQSIHPAESLRLPDGRLKLIDRVIELDPAGGRYGLGRIQAEADIHPDDWFLTCHFVDDMVMPGTLMYECCAHALRVFLQRIGWVAQKPGVAYEPVLGVESVLKCRGPVTPDTRRVLYEVEIKEIGYAPQPYAVADAHMFADGQRIVRFKNLSLQMSGITRDEIEALWRKRDRRSKVLFDRTRLVEFARGKPSKAFGEPYRPFDEQRFIARLPAPPFLFLDRITRIEPAPWVLRPDGWITAERDVSPQDWYFKAERNPAAPISVILEIALQPCGWLAAYLGSALRSPKDLHFRNLGGNARLLDEIPQSRKTLQVRSRLTQVSEAGDMIIEHYEFEVSAGDRAIYAGTTYFGFFTEDALANQQGIRDTRIQGYRQNVDEPSQGRSMSFADEAPLTPEDPAGSESRGMVMPAKAIRMIDRIDAFVPGGGSQGLGFLRGSKTVDPQEWFFRAHFHQDPVCPGSLGIESFIQLLKWFALDRWPHRSDSHRFGLLTGQPHTWTYRGQILPGNREITVDAVITHIQEAPNPTVIAAGVLAVDGLPIYTMENFGICLIPT